jgi:hypothetical protein
MCDYSLHNIASRPAKVGDELVTTSFYGTLTRGFAAAGEPYVAVCLCPGTELAFEERAAFFWLSGRTIHETAIFRQIDKDRRDTHHDALEFPDGRVVLLTQLACGQRATVLQLPAATPTGREIAEEHHSALVD